LNNQKTNFLGLFVGDSLSVGYCAVGVELEDTYAYLMEMYWRRLNPAAYVQSVRRPGALLAQIYGAAHDWLELNAATRKIDVCVIQCGVIDCAPRVVTHQMRTLISMLPKPFFKAIIGFLHNNRARLQKIGWSFRYTSPKKFERIYTNLVKLMSERSTRLYVVEIAPGKESVYTHSPGLKESILQYNAIIAKIVSRFSNAKLIDIGDFLRSNPELYLTDDLHVKKDGHYYIYTRISQLEKEA
jgi:lysophospholipase L1-like esterase